MIKKLSRSVLLVICCTSLGGCFEPEVEGTSIKNAQALADSVIFVKAKSGLCFGIASTSRLATNGVMAYSNMMVIVECEKVDL